MALGGGSFTATNKVLPGAYINFVSAASASKISDRGIAAMPLELDWGADGSVFSISEEELQEDSLKYFGYPYDDNKLKGIRDLFKHTRLCRFYRLINNGVKASNSYCEAKYKGTRGNDLKVVASINVDDNSKVDVVVYLGTILVDKQTVAPNTDNLADNEFVVWKDNIALEVTAGIPLSNGTNGDAITGTQYQDALSAFESYNFNALGCLSTESQISNLVAEYTRRMRDEVGVKFLAIVHKNIKDYEGVISVENTVDDDLESSLIYWVTGAVAGCEVNKSLTNKKYDGEFDINVEYKQNTLKTALKEGKFIFHRVGDEVRVLEDINTFTSITDEKSSDFSSTQTIRVLDQIANDIATIFNTKYLGNIPNDEAGRISLWSDIVTHHKKLQKIRAIENFNPDLITVDKGDSKKAVVVNNAVTPVNAMAQLYMSVIVQ